MSLSPGERTDLKKRIAASLAQQEWGDVDLTLREFGYSTTDQWQGNGERREYILDMLASSDNDDSLKQLDTYLHPTTIPPAIKPGTIEELNRPWSGQGLKLFVSHIVEDKNLAGELREELAKRSIDAFVAHDSISPTDEWEEVIKNALRSSDAAVALLTPGFQQSKWTDQEIGWCVARNIPVVPIDAGVTPYGFLGRYQSLKLKKGQTIADIAREIFELLITNPQSKDAMAQILVERWRLTENFDQARENYSYLKRIPREVWTQQLHDRVWQAYMDNNQLNDASIEWDNADKAIEKLFDELPFDRPKDTYSAEDQIPF